MAEEETPKVLDHPITHTEVSWADRAIFVVIGILLTVGVFALMGLI